MFRARWNLQRLLGGGPRHNPPELALLCIPRGGLNDTLCQIEQCWDYAERHGRTLLIDTRKSGLFADFAFLFSIRATDIAVVSRVSASCYEALRRLACRPNMPKGVGAHRTVYSRARGNFVDRGTGQLLTFDFGRDHPEPLLVHEQCGGGDLSRRLLDRVVLAPPLRLAVARALARLPDDYAAVHVRNTDHRTHYEPFFEALRPGLAGRNVLVCSDDATVIAKARQAFDRSRVLTATELPAAGGRPLHLRGTHRSDRARVRATVAAITDLLALGGAQELHFADVAAGHPSGFSQLARYLNENKPVIAALLSRAEAGRVTSG